MACISTLKLIALISKCYQWQTDTEHFILHNVVNDLGKQKEKEFSIAIGFS